MVVQKDAMRDEFHERSHGSHTLKVWAGIVVGLNGDDVFVELGPRMQGVISRRRFESDPAVGDEHDFTLGGKEEDLWALSLSEERSLATWESMEVGSLVQARVLRKTQGGMQLKIGPLHAFLPRSQAGIPREQKPDVLIGKTITVEVIEVDPERQRVIVSRKIVAQRERTDDRQRAIGKLEAGAVVQGRVTRIEDYGAFVAFTFHGKNMEGLVHVSNLSIERVNHPEDLLAIDQDVEAKVLTIKQGGRRIALGLKQMAESPWSSLETRHYEGEIVEGKVTRLEDYGAFVQVEIGVEGLVHVSEMGLAAGRAIREALSIGRKISVRIQEMDCEEERLALSLLHTTGAPIDLKEAEARKNFETLDKSDNGAAGTNLGTLLEKAFGSNAANPRPSEEP